MLRWGLRLPPLSGSVGEPEGWRRHALVLVDLQHDFWSPETASTAPHLPDRTTELLGFARREGITVVHLRARFAPDASNWMARYRLRGWIPCVEGTPGVETLPFAVERVDEPVVVKHTFDGFLGTDLDDLLRRRGIGHVLIAGLVTSTCVLFTAASATQRGYLATVVTDCCSDRREAHEATLATYPFVFGTVSSDEIAARRPEWEAALDRMGSPTIGEVGLSRPGGSPAQR
ncbi:MAG: cysteine hydrolase family protein [Ilumatobacteraceae bacterium]